MMYSVYREELEETREELHEVKDLYVNACKDKDDLEEKLTDEWKERLEQELQKVSIY